MDRRDFLLAGGALGAAALAPAWLAHAQSPRPRRSFYVDAQGGLSGYERGADGRVTFSPKLLDVLANRRIDLISTTITEVGNGPDRFRSAVEDIAQWNDLVRQHSGRVMKIESPADIRAAREGGKLGLIYNFQDTAALESDAGRVDTFANLGVKVIQLTYNKRNLSGDGCLERANAGLSDFGREVIARINKANVLLDLSHAGRRTIAEGIAASTAPPSITHSGCRALVDLARNTHDSEMRALADKGGVFGIYLMPFLRSRGQPGPDDLFRHLDHAVKICGEDHVGIGTDNPLLGYEVNEDLWRRHRERLEGRIKLGISAPGEQADVLRFVEGYNSGDRFDLIAADLRRRGWRAARIDKVLGGNFVRLFGEVWRG